MSFAPLLAGHPAPRFTARASNNPEFRLDSAAGRHLILVFLGSAGTPCGQRTLAAIEPFRVLLNDIDLALFFVSEDPEDERQARLVQRLPGIRVFWDFERRLSALYGAGDAAEGTAYLLNPRLQVMAGVSLADPARAMGQLFERAADQPRPLSQPAATGFAPVLYVPQVFEPDLCRNLIELFERGPSYESGFMREKNGRTVVVNDPLQKQRRDYEIVDTSLRAVLRQRIERRLLPEIDKAMQFRATRIERYIVARYEDTGGYFRPHRDNINRGTAHRQFAVSLNLNAEEYEGGDLCFPEFGALTYRPASGDALVFSCSLLHEALPVRRGRRYAFLPFLYDEAGERIREANQAYVDTSQAGR